MIRLNFRGHVNPQTGNEPWQRALAAGFRGSVGENLAYGMLTPQDAVQSLLAQPPALREPDGRPLDTVRRVGGERHDFHPVSTC